MKALGVEAPPVQSVRYRRTSRVSPVRYGASENSTPHRSPLRKSGKAGSQRVVEGEASPLRLDGQRPPDDDLQTLPVNSN